MTNDKESVEITWKQLHDDLQTENATSDIYGDIGYIFKHNDIWTACFKYVDGMDVDMPCATKSKAKETIFEFLQEDIEEGRSKK